MILRRRRSTPLSRWPARRPSITIVPCPARPRIARTTVADAWIAPTRPASWRMLFCGSTVSRRCRAATSSWTDPRQRNRPPQPYDPKDGRSGRGKLACDPARRCGPAEPSPAYRGGYRRSNRGARQLAGLIYPDFKSTFEPCLPSRATGVPNRRDWIHQAKHDPLPDRSARRVS
jgi:hypothetical protein